MVSTLLLAAYRLPREIVVDADAVGLTFETRVVSVAVSVMLPEEQEPDAELDTDDMAAGRRGPDRPGVDDQAPAVVEPWRTAVPGPAPAELGWYRRRDRAAAATLAVRRVLMRIREQDVELPTPRVGSGVSSVNRFGDHLVQHVDAWYRMVRSWLEVYTTQDLDHEAPRWEAEVEGGGLATFRPDGARLGAAGRVRVDMYDEVPADAALLSKALFEAGQGNRPPLQWELLRDGRAAWHRHNYRRAVIEAATACELSLAQLRHVHDSDSKPTPLGGLLTKLERDKALPSGLTRSLRANVVGPRNDAIHRGATPAAGEAAEALRAAEAAMWFVAAPDGGSIRQESGS